MPTAVRESAHNLKGIVTEFIREAYLFGSEDHPLGEDDSLMEQGIVDSTGILELAAFLQSRFNVSVEDEEFLPENLDTLNNLCAYILRKTDGSLAALL